MMSKVFFTDMRAKKADDTINKKIQKLFDNADFSDIISKGDLVALKTHFGTGDNHRHLRPQHLRAVVEKVKEAGGKPFLTETTGLGLESDRGTAVGCFMRAILNGFTPETVGAPIIVADGLKGFSGIKVKVKGVKLNEVEIAQVIAESDVLISISHSKGHPKAGFASSLKNMGMGCVIKNDKASFHLSKKPEIDHSKCNDCGVCISFCPVGAIRRSNGKPQVIKETCIWGCGCWDICPQKAFLKWTEMQYSRNSELLIRNLDAVAAVIKHIGKENIAYMNMAYEITPHCDCSVYGDVPMVPDVGIFASKDPIAIDKATSDAIQQMSGIKGSASEEINVMKSGEDKFAELSQWPPFEALQTEDGTRNWRFQFDIGEKLGLGTQNYQLIKI